MVFGRQVDFIGYNLLDERSERPIFRRLGAIIRSIKILKKSLHMQSDIHPQVHPVIFRDANAGKDFVIASTLTSEEVEEIGGVKHYVVRVDVSSASHPFYTGKQNLLDTSGRVDKFRAKMERAKAASADAKAKADTSVK